MNLEMLFANDADRIKKLLSRVLKAKENKKNHVEYAIFEKGKHRKHVFVSLSYFHDRKHPYVMRIQILEDGYKVKYWESDNPHVLVIYPLQNSLFNYGLILLKERSRELGENEDFENVDEIKNNISMDYKISTYKLFPPNRYKGPALQVRNWLRQLARRVLLSNFKTNKTAKLV